MSRRVGRRAVLALGASTALAACTTSPVKSDPTAPASVGARPGGYLAGTQLDRVWSLPSEPLTAADGSSTSMAEKAGTVTLVFFGYTHCPDVCTGILADLSSAIQRLEPGQSERVVVQFVTTDPARDTPAVIAEYLHRIDEKFVGLTGPLSTITQVASSMGILIEQGTKLPSGGYEINHGTQVIGFGKDKTAQVLWSQGTAVANYKADIGLLLSRQE